MKILTSNAEYAGFAHILINIKMCVKLNDNMCVDGI